MKNIFAETAPAYYAAGIPVIPLHRMEKRPIPQGWNKFAEEMPSQSEWEGWLKDYPDGNIGLVLGKCSGVSVMDIDTDDTTVINIIRTILPTTMPWVRVGKKGMVIAFRYSGIKTFRIKTADGKSLCEFLSDRTQVVLPPSIHPDTRLPYTANVDFLKVYQNLVACPEDLEARLRKALTDAGVELSSSGWSRVTEFVAPGQRDLNLTAKAGLFAYAVMRGERTLREAVAMLRSYNEEFVQNVAGDAMDVEKHVKNLILFLHRDVHHKKKILPEGWDEGLTDEEKKEWGCDFDRDSEEWRYEEIMKYLQAEFELENGEGGPGSMTAVEKIMVKLSASNNLSGLDKDRVMSYICKSSGCNLSLQSLRRHIRTLSESDGMKGTNHTEIANALLEDIEQIHPLRFVTGVFWKYNGAYWEKLDEGWLTSKLSKNYGHLPAVKKFGDIKGILNLLRSLVSDKYPSGLCSMLVDMRVINFANGVLAVNHEGKRSLLPHSPDFGLTYVLPFRYTGRLELGSSIEVEEDVYDDEGDLVGTRKVIGDTGGSDINPQRDMPLFRGFMEQSWGEDVDFEAKVMALQEMLAATLFGAGSKYQRVFLLHGVPKSGKSQLLKIASSLVPDNAKSAVNPADWNDRFAPAQMFKKLLNVAGELSDTRRIDGQRFKDIVDGSEIMGQFKYENAFRFTVDCTHWFASNHSPRTEDTSEGFTRRWLVLDFRKPVNAEARVIGFGEEVIAREREAIAAWAVEGMTRLVHQSDYTLPASHREIIHEMANMNNTVRAFVTSCVDITVGEGGEIDEMTLYHLFWSFNLAVTQSRAIPIPDFRSKMRELGVSYGFTVGEGRYYGLKKRGK